MQNGMPARKHPRLKGYDYSNAGAYFITFCVKNGKEILGKPAAPPPPGITSWPYIELSEYGKIVDKHINRANALNHIIMIDKYVIMPSHVHMIVFIQSHAETENDAMKQKCHTSASIPSLIRSIKTMVTKEIGHSLWQSSYHDHIIRDEEDYQRRWRYIDENPIKWIAERAASAFPIIGNVTP